MHINNATHDWPFWVNVVCLSDLSCVDHEVLTRLKDVGKLEKLKVQFQGVVVKS